jgi:polar amino acid transport system substrate-binding protein
MKKNRIIAVLATVLLLGFLPMYANGQKETSSKLSLAGSGGYPPFNFMLENGSVDGFDVDVAREIASRMGMELQYVTTSWDGIIEGLRAGRYDGILGSMGITEARRKIVDFSDPYYYSGPQLIVRKDSGISGIQDLTKDRTVALVTGTTFENDARTAGVTVKLYEDDNQTLMELINGRVDGVLTDRIVGLNAMKKMKGGEDLMLAGPVLRTEAMGIAFKKGSPLPSKINMVLKDMRQDGTMKRISDKWFPGEDITVE